ncbi:MAG: hypothetical protein IPK60_22245 [Sandaracinaceae bacterium]|nr:hypothetical protein [Sandaracinaceae bacterium]
MSRATAWLLAAWSLVALSCTGHIGGSDLERDASLDAATVDAANANGDSGTTYFDGGSFDAGPECMTAPSAEIVATARAWLAASGSERVALEAPLRAYTSCIDSVVHELRPHAFPSVAPGDYFDQTYETPELFEKQGDHHFNFHVPSFYSPDTPIGLVIWMHGGGSHDDTEWSWVMQNMHPWEGGKRCYARPELDEAPYILVVPIAPFGHLLPAGAEAHASRWNVIGADVYLMNIIEEFEHRFNIDTNHVVLAGHSMGGVGAYHQVFRLADRVAAVFTSAGAWNMGPWEALRYTPFYLHHGTDDSYWNSPSDYRWHGTDVAYPRLADEILSGLGIDHVYWEFVGGHGWSDAAEDPLHSGELGWSEFVDGAGGWLADKVRDPYRADVVAVTPRTSYLHGGNFGVEWDETPTPDTMWLTIRRVGSGTIPFDVANNVHDGDYSTHEAWADFSVQHEVENVAGGMIHGHLASGNVVTLTTDNVEELSVWLHPRMVDARLPIHVSVDGVSHDYPCAPTLLDTLRSFERRRDWSMSYQCEVRINVSDHR